VQEFDEEVGEELDNEEREEMVLRDREVDVC
jgi:hypothetical protein